MGEVLVIAAGQLRSTGPAESMGGTVRWPLAGSNFPLMNLCLCHSALQDPGPGPGAASLVQEKDWQMLK